MSPPVGPDIQNTMFSPSFDAPTATSRLMGQGRHGPCHIGHVLRVEDLHLPHRCLTQGRQQRAVREPPWGPKHPATQTRAAFFSVVRGTVVKKVQDMAGITLHTL